MARGQELLTYVVYDISSDRIRLRIAGVCKDYGLAHIQYSVFRGPLNATHRNALCSRLRDTLGPNEGRIVVLPLCEKDAAATREILGRARVELL